MLAGWVHHADVRRVTAPHARPRFAGNSSSVGFLRRTVRVLGAAARAFLDDRGPQLAASIAYFALFAVFPLTILLVAALGLIVGEDVARREVVDFVLENVPLREDAGRRELEAVLREVTANAGAFGAVGIAGLLFSASGLMGALRNALSHAFDVEEARPLVLGKLVDVALVLAVGLVAGLSLVLTLLERLALSVSQTVSDAVGPELSVVTDVVLALGQLVPAVLAATVFAFLYRFVPAREVAWRRCLAAAVVAGLMYEAVKTAFAFYLRNLADYGAVYGSIATVIAFMLFAFLSANVFVFGAELARSLERERDDEHGPLAAARRAA